MSKDADDKTSRQLTLFAVGSPAKTFRWLDAALDWLESEADSGMSSIELLRSLLHDGLLLKTSVDFCHLTKDGIWESSSGRWANSGMGGPTRCLTLSTSEFRSGAVVSSLLDVLETGPVPQKYFLSPRAAQGILRRAEKRGRELPPLLRQALQAVAEGEAGP